MPGSTGNGTAQLNRMHAAISQIAEYYKLSNVMEDALVSADPGDFSGETAPNEDGSASGEVLAAAIAERLDPNGEAGMLEFVRDLLFSSCVGHLPAAEMVQILENTFGDDPESMSIIAIQPHNNAGGDLKGFSVTGSPWPGGAIFTGGLAFDAGAGLPVGHRGMLNYDTNREALEEEVASAANATKIFHIASTHGTFTKSASDGNALTVFFNSLPTHELSRAVPYLDVQFFQEGGYDNPLVKAPNLYRFLLGDQGYAAEDVASITKASKFSTTDDEGPSNPSAALDQGVTAIDFEGMGMEPPDDSSARWVSGMEVFTSPQTLVRGDERTAGIHRTGGLNRPYSGVMHPFRPFMSLMGLTINIHPAMNNIIFTEGTLKLKLHDRSRMAEISGLVSPGGFGRTFLKITYGWSHPAGNPHSLENNPFGMFIDSMKTEEHFTISTADYSFTTSGEVEITCKIYSRAAGDLTQDVQILEDLCVDELKLMERFESLCLQASNHYPSDPTPGFPSRDSTVIANVENSNGAYALQVDAAGIRDLQTRIARLRSTPEPELDQIANDLEKAVQGLASARTNISIFWNRKIQALRSGPDPWLSTVDSQTMRGMHGTDSASAHLGFVRGHRTPRYVSLAKVISIFLAQPLGFAGSNNYAEIQFFYGCVNHNASYASDLNLASYPIKLNGELGIIRGLGRLKDACGFNIVLGDFMGFLNNYFFENHLNPIYGFDSVRGESYEFDEDTGLMSLKYSSERAQQRSTDSMAAVLQDAYEGEDRTFQCPTLNFSMRSAPIATIPGTVSAHSNQSVRNASESILRIFFEDAKATPYNGAQDAIKRVFDEHLPGALETQQPVLGPAWSENLDTVGTFNGTFLAAEVNRMRQVLTDFGIFVPEIASDGQPSGRMTVLGSGDWKGILKSMAPNIDVGSSNTAVKTISMSNQSGGNLQAINMIRGTQGAPGESQATSLPMSMMPQKASATFFGCPFLAPMQQFFIDMRTGTDIDSMYGVFKVSHVIQAGKFETKAELLYQGGYASFAPTISKINRLAATMSAGINNEENGAADIPGIEILSTDPSTSTTAVEDLDPAELAAAREAYAGFDRATQVATSNLEAHRQLALDQIHEVGIQRAQAARAARALQGGTDFTTWLDSCWSSYRSLIQACFLSAASCYDRVAGTAPISNLEGFNFSAVDRPQTMDAPTRKSAYIKAATGWGGSTVPWKQLMSTKRRGGGRDLSPCAWPPRHQNNIPLSVDGLRFHAMGMENYLVTHNSNRTHPSYIQAHQDHYNNIRGFYTFCRDSAGDLDTFMANTNAEARQKLRTFFPRGVAPNDNAAWHGTTKGQIQTAAWKNMLKMRNCCSSKGNPLTLANAFISSQSKAWAMAYDGGNVAFGLSQTNMNHWGPMTALIIKNNDGMYSNAIKTRILDHDGIRDFLIKTPAEIAALYGAE
jgi:hypothetical protein